MPRNEQHSPVDRVPAGGVFGVRGGPVDLHERPVGRPGGPGVGSLGRPAGRVPAQASGMVYYRRLRRPERISFTRSSGCSQAAKWPPLGTWL